LVPETVKCVPVELLASNQAVDKRGEIEPTLPPTQQTPTTGPSIPPKASLAV